MFEMIYRRTSQDREFSLIRDEYASRHRRFVRGFLGMPTCSKRRKRRKTS